MPLPLVGHSGCGREGGHRREGGQGTVTKSTCSRMDLRPYLIVTHVALQVCRLRRGRGEAFCRQVGIRGPAGRSSYARRARLLPWPSAPSTFPQNMPPPPPGAQWPPCDTPPPPPLPHLSPLPPPSPVPYERADFTLIQGGQVQHTTHVTRACINSGAGMQQGAARSYGETLPLLPHC